MCICQLTVALLFANHDDDLFDDGVNYDDVDDINVRMMCDDDDDNKDWLDDYVDEDILLSPMMIMKISLFSYVNDHED